MLFRLILDCFVRLYDFFVPTIILIAESLLYKLKQKRSRVFYFKPFISVCCISYAIAFFFLLFRPHQIKKPVMGKPAQTKLAMKASIFPGNPKMLPTCKS